MILLCGGPLGDALEAYLRDAPVREASGKDLVIIRRERPARPSWENPDDLVLAAGWWEIIPKAIVESRRCYGIHWSLLPKYRGWSPLNWAIINGEQETGVSVFRMTSRVDAGDLLAQATVPILPADSAGSLVPKLVDVSVRLIEEHLEALLAGNETLTPQTGEPSYFPRRKPEDGRIDLSWPAERVVNMVRALTPPFYPGAFIEAGDGRRVVIYKAEVV